jgi:hypothetical protein
LILVLWNGFVIAPSPLLHVRLGILYRGKSYAIAVR